MRYSVANSADGNFWGGAPLRGATIDRQLFLKPFEHPQILEPPLHQSVVT
jgi:hypothetical protein